MVVVGRNCEQNRTYCTSLSQLWFFYTGDSKTSVDCCSIISWTRSDINKRRLIDQSFRVVKLRKWQKFESPCIPIRTTYPSNVMNFPSCLYCVWNTCKPIRVGDLWTYFFSYCRPRLIRYSYLCFLAGKFIWTYVPQDNVVGFRV